MPTVLHITENTVQEVIQQLLQMCELAQPSDVKFGYTKILHPLIHDLASLEQHGVYVEKLGECVKGTFLYVAADNLAAQSLAGFFKSFTVDRFCMANRVGMQAKEVNSGAFEHHAIDTQKQQVQEVKQDPTMAKWYGVEGECVMMNGLEHFHVVRGYPLTSSMTFWKGLFLLSYRSAFQT